MLFHFADLLFVCSLLSCSYLNQEAYASQCTIVTISKEYIHVFPFAQFVQARVVTEDDVAENRFQMTDIVLPMPGFDIIYPANEMAEKYWHLLKEDLGVKDYDWRHPNKYGALMALMAVYKPFREEFNCCKYRSVVRN